MFPHATCLLWNKKSPNIISSVNVDDQNNSGVANQWKIVWPSEHCVENKQQKIQVSNFII